MQSSLLKKTAGQALENPLFLGVMKVQQNSAPSFSSKAESLGNTDEKPFSNELKEMSTRTSAIETEEATELARASVKLSAERRKLRV